MKRKGSIIILMALISALGLAVGYKYYKFSKEDPAYCSMCHRTLEGYNSHATSVHYMITCQVCHEMSTMEGNRLMLAYYVKGDKHVKQEQGRIKPWEKCIDCHNSSAEQGSVTFRSSYGHARHVFMHDIGCNKCHTSVMHKIEVSADKCRVCHTDKLVHGMGTAGLYCLNCHSFSDESRKMQASRKCTDCHNKLKTGKVMSELECHDCHKPHSKLKLKSKDCLGSCHSSETRVGQHSLHLALDKVECITCHKPHVWTVTKKTAPGICDRCHKLKDPATFIY